MTEVCWSIIVPVDRKVELEDSLLQLALWCPAFRCERLLQNTTVRSDGIFNADDHRLSCLIQCPSMSGYTSCPVILWLRSEDIGNFRGYALRKLNSSSIYTCGMAGVSPRFTASLSRLILARSSRELQRWGLTEVNLEHNFQQSLVNHPQGRWDPLYDYHLASVKHEPISWSWKLGVGPFKWFSNFLISSAKLGGGWRPDVN